MTERNAYRCPNYVGVSCVDGSCPKALRDEYQERGTPCVWRCSDCWMYEGCKDCAFVRGQICPKTEDTKMEDKAKLGKVRLVDADKLMDLLMRVLCDDFCGLEVGSAECASECLADQVTGVISHYAERHSVDAEPVRHEKWEPYIGPFSAPVFRCSACGSQTAHFNRHPYCFGCGAKMDGDLR